MADMAPSPLPTPFLQTQVIRPIFFFPAGAPTAVQKLVPLLPFQFPSGYLFWTVGLLLRFPPSFFYINLASAALFFFTNQSTYHTFPQQSIFLPPQESVCRFYPLFSPSLLFLVVFLVSLWFFVLLLVPVFKMSPPTLSSPELCIRFRRRHCPEVSSSP